MKPRAMPRYLRRFIALIQCSRVSYHFCKTEQVSYLSKLLEQKACRKYAALHIYIALHIYKIYSSIPHRQGGEVKTKKKVVN